MVSLILSTGFPLGKIKKHQERAVSLSDGLGQVRLREWQKLKSIYDIHNQEWRVSRKHVDGEVFSYPYPKIYGKEFLEVGDVEEHFVLGLQCVLSR